MKRRKGLRRQNRRRAARKRRRNFVGPWDDYAHDDLVRSLPCALSRFHRCEGRVVAAHVRARGMGGAKGGWWDQAPLCEDAHRQFDGRFANRARLLEEELGVDLEAVARDLAEGACRAHGTTLEEALKRERAA